MPEDVPLAAGGGPDTVTAGTDAERFGGSVAAAGFFGTVAACFGMVERLFTLPALAIKIGFLAVRKVAFGGCAAAAAEIRSCTEA